MSTSGPNYEKENMESSVNQQDTDYDTFKMPSSLPIPDLSAMTNSSPSFSLRASLTPTSYTVVSNLPTKDFIESLEKLAPQIKSTIINCIKNIYSHVTERKPSEDTAHFFIHVAATTLYEAFTNTKVKGKDHANKAYAVGKNITNTIQSITKELSKRQSDVQRDLLETSMTILKAHKKVIDYAITQLRLEQKDHLALHQGYQESPLTSLSPNSKNLVESCYPQPELEKRTPKRLRPADIQSLAAIKSKFQKTSQRSAPGKQINFSGSESESDDSSEESENLYFKNRTFTPAKVKHAPVKAKQTSWEDKLASQFNYDGFMNEDELTSHGNTLHKLEYFDSDSESTESSESEQDHKQKRFTRRS